MFDDKTIQEIKYYVYALRDPRNWEIFYIGKWVWNRIFQHSENALKESNESDKLDRIRDIIKSKNNVEHFLVRHGLSEDIAHEIEATLIDLFKNKKSLKLDITNIVQWSHTYDRWIISTNEANALYWGKKINITDPVVLININKLFKRNMTEEELYMATRESRPLWKNKEKAKYWLVHYKWIVREVYKINSRYPIKDHNWRTRWGFEWEIANSSVRSKYIFWLVKEYFKKWAAFPIRYINC